jgi:hypothetical protein
MKNNQLASQQCHRLMGCTLKELVAWLPAASNFRSFTINRLTPNEILFPDDGVKIVAMPQQSRQIALLVIPVLDVVFNFDSRWDKLALDQFMKRFDMYTQRGGG